ncbi:glycoside hydrolase family 95 protein [Arcicella sp. DC2W]|uniref:Glycoside hydrolase family 95 protein n=1 Tax=Arcicella gelida TaxID=2984195 RepID=A0ABU5S2M2_9BACT|nr:glycoside hydrolase family 95 protein [Arcicella sp. DC2W]MEA5402727.1 glycoside hydrolase family 95 protein [Arcicella sp. DC2W]
MLRSLLFLPFLCCSLLKNIAKSPNQSHHKNTLNYYFNTPASNWNEAIPIGNGRMGSMIFGTVNQELIQTNDDTFWSGEPRNIQKPGTYQYLEEIRKQIKHGNTSEAQKLINSHMLGAWNQSYMPLADILLRMNQDETQATAYKRSLDLSTGIVTIAYKQKEVNYKREIFASFPQQAIIIRLTADKKKALNLIASLQSLVKYQTHSANQQLIINGQAPIHIEPNYQGVHPPIYQDRHGMRFEGRLFITETDGQILADSNQLKLQNASFATLVFVDATSYNGFDKDPFSAGKDEKKQCEAYSKGLLGKSYQAIRQAHIKDYQALFGRVNLHLGTSTEDNFPLDQRIKNYNKDKDPALTALYFQFGRYLLISSSRKGSQPANLQGIWSNLLQPAWSANWTINCNAQINYWPVELANLSECHLPLLNLIRETTVDGQKTAKNLYNSRGWMAHHNIDLWRTTWPVGGNGLWAIYQVGGAWLCQHIWEHYLFTQDKQFLAEYFPILYEASLFYVDNLQEDGQGYLVTNPSESFENHYFNAKKEKVWACEGAAQDMQIIRSLLKNTLQAFDILGKDQTQKLEIARVLARLAPMKISPRTGQLQEWNDDWDAAEPFNGQVPHGWGLVASDLITLHQTPDLAKAIRQTITYRKPAYAMNTGSWSGAFAANFWARLAEGDSVQMVLDRHFSKALYTNLTCQFTGFWQIDGNLGMTAAIGEMLMQSQGGEIALLPALPSKYPTGYVTGLKARGGYTVDVFWENTKLTKVVIKSRLAGKVSIRYKDKVKQLTVKPLSSFTLTDADFL